MTISSSMNIAQQALLVNQASISIISNNIANVSTEGYSRQSVILSPAINYTPINGSPVSQARSSAGVELLGVNRYTDSYLQAYYVQQNSVFNYYDQYSEVATQIEDITNELTGSKLEDAFTSFYKAAQTLSSNPSDSTARQNYAQAVQTIALKFNELSASMSSVRTSLVGDITIPGSLEKSKIYLQGNEVNNLLTQLADINADIIKVSSDQMKPNSLLDLRDQIVEKISNFLPVNYSENENGTINLAINGIEVVKGTELLGKLNVVEGGTDDTPAVIQLKSPKGVLISSNINSYINSGSMGALLDVSGVNPNLLTVKGVLNDLDTLASGFAEMINTLQTDVNADGTPMAIDQATKTLIASTEDIFTSSTGGPITAANIMVNQDILDNPYLIAAARVGAASTANEIGNNSNMIAVLNTRTNVTPPMGKTPEAYLADMVGSVGIKVENIETKLKNQDAVLSAVNTQLTSATGVNMDEELADLIRFQRAYQASARVFGVCSDLLETLVNLGK